MADLHDLSEETSPFSDDMESISSPLLHGRQDSVFTDALVSFSRPLLPVNLTFL